MQTKRFTKDCKRCGTQFDCVQDRKEYCSVSCRVKTRQEENTAERKCIYCDVVFTPPRDTQKQCVSQRDGGCPNRYAARYERKCVICDTHFVAASTRRLTCSDECRREHFWPKRQTTTRACPICSTTFEAVGNHNKRFCSKSCKKKAERLDPKHAARNRAYSRQYQGKVKSKQCPECLQYGVRNDSTYCSFECSRAARMSKCTDIVIWEPKAHKHLTKSTTAPTAPKPRIIAQGSCHECGKQFTAIVIGNQRIPRFCGNRCIKKSTSRNNHHMRRMRITSRPSENIYRRTVLERCNYTCQLCHQPLDMKAHRNSDWAPSLDHIIPIAEGGTHTMDNVQMAHRICNSYKRDSLNPVKLPKMPISA